MMKTEMQIERDFYTFIKTGTIGTAIHGDVYRSEMRPANAVTEDAVDLHPFLPQQDVHAHFQRGQGSE